VKSISFENGPNWKVNSGVISGTIPIRSFYSKNGQEEKHVEKNEKQNHNGRIRNQQNLHRATGLYPPASSRKPREESKLPFLLLRDATSTDWTEQWPIGNGRIGALVGGTRFQEVVPISISGLYLSQKKKVRIPEDNSKTRRIMYQASREALLRGDFKRAKEEIEKVTEGGLGSFQYAADLVLQYGLRPQQLKDVLLEPIHAAPDSHPPPIKRAYGSRSELLRSLANIMEQKSDRSNQKMSVLISETALDMKNGIAHWEFLEKDVLERVLYFTKREWFASAVDDVIVSEAKCDKVYAEGNTSRKQDLSCINMAILIDRTNAPDVDVDININVNTFKPPSYYSNRDNSVKAASFDMSFGGDDRVLSPTVHLCGVVTCSATEDDKLELIHTVKPFPLIICNNASKVRIVVSASLYQDHISPSLDVIPEHIDPESLARNECWQKLNAAMKYEPQELRRRHETDFIDKMSATELVLGQENNHSVSISQVYQHSRYLMMSSSRNSVSNLQGLWADGPSSSWSGGINWKVFNIAAKYHIFLILLIIN